MQLSIILILTFFTVSFSKSEFKDKTDEEFQNSCLSLHNEHRAKHHSPPMKIDEKAVQYAKDRCLLVAQDKKGSGPPGTDKDFGENRYKGGELGWGAAANQPAPCKDAVDYWYKNSKGYDYKKHKGKSTFGFTQLIWKETTGLGCARCFGKQDDKMKTQFVCNYLPRGNYKNKFKENVLKP